MDVDPEHFAERYALLVIIALGEVLIATGEGVEQAGLRSSTWTVAALGLLLAAGVWWLYFRVVADVAERALHDDTSGRFAGSSIFSVELGVHAGV